MREFDYARAWREVAAPGYMALSESVLALVGTVAEKAGGLRQLPDCSMPWPEDGGELRRQFEAIPADELALAAHTVNYVGHWRPSASERGDFAAVVLPGSEVGASWKFTHYADQVLRGLLGLRERGHDYGNGVHIEAHEGMLRVCYSSKHMWTWVECAPATPEGKVQAERYAARLRASYAGINNSHTHKRDTAAYTTVEALRAELHAQTDGTAAGPWPAAWVPWASTERFMVERER